MKTNYKSVIYIYTHIYIDGLRKEALEARKTKTWPSQTDLGTHNGKRGEAGQKNVERDEMRSSLPNADALCPISSS